MGTMFHAQGILDSNILDNLPVVRKVMAGRMVGAHYANFSILDGH